MKTLRRILTMLLCLTTWQLVACSGAASEKAVALQEDTEAIEDLYKYAEADVDFGITYPDWKPSEFVPYSTSAEEWEDALTYIKAQTASYFRTIGLGWEDVEWLDWEKFYDVGIRNMYTDAAEAAEMPENLREVAQYYAATYDWESNQILLFDEFVRGNDETQDVCILTHELIHSLIPNYGWDEDYLLVEGAVDKYAEGVLKNNLGIGYSPHHAREVICYGIMSRVYGEQEVLRELCEETLVEEIEAATKPGMAKRLTEALTIANLGRKNSNVGSAKALAAEYAWLDVMAHLARNEGRGEAASGYIDGALMEMGQAFDTSIDYGYFNRLLHSR